MKLPRLIAFLLVFVLLSTACLPAPTAAPAPSQTLPATQAPILSLPTVTIASTATEIPATAVPATETTVPTPGADSFALGEPFWLGRGKVRDAAFLPGARLLVIAWGSGVSLHQVESGQELWFQSTPSNLIAFDLHPLGEMFAAALSDGSVMVFDAADGAARRFEGAKPNAYWGDLAWSPDGQTVAFQFIGANRSDPIYLLDVASGQVSQVPDSQTGEGVGPSLVWSPDSSAITVAALGEACSRFVDVQSGELRMLLGQSGACYELPPLAFLPDGESLAVNAPSGGIDILNYPDGARLRSLQGIGEPLVGRQLEFPATGGSLFVDLAGQWIATRGGYEPCYCGYSQYDPHHPLVVWDLVSGEIVAQQARAREPLAERHRLAAAFDGASILVFFESGEITRWKFVDPQAGDELLAQVPVRPTDYGTVRWSANGDFLAFRGSYGGVEVYEPATQQLVRRFDPPLESPALSPDGSLVALYDPLQGAELIYELRSGQLVLALPASPTILGPAFSPDGEVLAYADNPDVLVAELATGEVLTLDTSAIPTVDARTAVSRLIWSADGQALVSELAERNPDLDGPGVIVLWQRQADGSFEAIYHLSNYRANYEDPRSVLAAFNPAGSRVALSSIPQDEASQTSLVVYDLQAGMVFNSFQEYRLGGWVDDDVLLASQAQYDTRLSHVNVLTGELSVGDGRDMGDNAYAPGGLFTAQMANPPQRGVTVKYWQNNAVIAFGEHPSLNLLDWLWSPDSRWLASVGDDGTLRVWPVVMP